MVLIRNDTQGPHTKWTAANSPGRKTSPWSTTNQQIVRNADNTRTHSPPCWSPSDHELSPDEVAQLWSFAHGDFMGTGIRQRLSSFRGFCSRHTWGYAVVEIELWQSAPGSAAATSPSTWPSSTKACSTIW